MRSNLVDVLKGFLIYSVVLGHSIQVLLVNFDESALFKVIYSLHMPFFFLVSGYLAGLSLSKRPCTINSCFTNKVLFLVVPFLAWYILYFFINQSLEDSLFDYMKSLVLSVDRGLWYIWVLFLMYIVLLFASMVQSRIPSINILIVLLLFILLLPNNALLGLQYLKWYLIFFASGMAIFNYRENILKIESFINSNLFLFLMVVLYASMMAFWQRNYSMDSIFYNQYIYMGFKLLVAFVGIYLFYRSVMYLLSKFQLINVGKLGRNSLGIYILNIPVIGFLSQVSNSENIIFILLVSVLALACSHFLSLYLSRIKYISILFGVKV